MAMHLPPGVLAFGLWIKSRFSRSAAEKLVDLRGTFDRRMELKNWLSSLEANVHPHIPETGTAEQCPPGVYEQVFEVSCQLTDDQFLKIAHFFDAKTADAVHELDYALSLQLRAISELTVSTKLMAQSPDFKPRDQLLADYSQRRKMLHHHFCVVRDMMVAHLERMT